MKITELCALKSRRLRVTGPGWWRILQCIFHLNHLVNSNLIWTCNEFCCTIHNIFHIYSWYEIFGWIFSIHSDFLLTPLKTDDFSKKKSITFTWWQTLYLLWKARLYLHLTKWRSAHSCEFRWSLTPVWPLLRNTYWLYMVTQTGKKKERNTDL